MAMGDLDRLIVRCWSAERLTGFVSIACDFAATSDDREADTRDLLEGAREVGLVGIFGEQHILDIITWAFQQRDVHEDVDDIEIILPPPPLPREPRHREPKIAYSTLAAAEYLAGRSQQELDEWLAEKPYYQRRLIVEHLNARRDRK
jgi:hypothetical protein